MSRDFVGAEHDFHSEAFARGWAERFVPTAERVRLFELICAQLRAAVPHDGQVVELGIGPGYLASYLLERLPGITYLGIDFSLPMLTIAQARLREHSARVAYRRADLIEDAWENHMPAPVHAVVSTWALHDLGSPANTRAVYARSYRALRATGLLINGDFIKPGGALQAFEGGRFPVAEHLALLDDVGFAGAHCLSLFEEELLNPAPAQNYACIRAEK